MTKKYKNTLKNPIPQPEIVKAPEKKSVSKNNYVPYAILFILSILLYGNTLKNGYVLDDVVVITQNEFTKKGFAGISEIFSYDTFTGYLGKQKKLVAGGRYRPLSVATFAVEYQFFGQMPWFSHLINLLLYAGIVLLLYKIFDNLFRQRFMAEYKWYLSPAFFVALLYLFHPIHTEAVANIKGRDELMTFLGALFAMWYSIKYVETKNVLNLAYIFVAFFLGLLSKENTITFLAIIPLTLYFFTQSKFKQILTALAPALLASVVFLIIRQTIIGGFSEGTTDNLINNAFAEADTLQRYGTVFYTFLVYLKLLVFPHPLTVDYYPYHIPLVALTQWQALLGIAVILALGTVAIFGFRNKSIYAYAVWFYAASFSVVSNLFFSIGTFMNERFIFISSFAFTLVVGYVIAKIINEKFQQKNFRYAVIGLFAAVLGLYGFKTVHRNSQWENEFILFSNDVKISKNSAFTNNAFGGALVEKALAEKDSAKREMYLARAVSHLSKSVSVFPKFDKAEYLLGNAHFLYNKNYKEALKCYFNVLSRDPGYKEIFVNAPLVIAEIPDKNYRGIVLDSLYKYNPNSFEVNNHLGAYYLIDKVDFDKAIKHLTKANAIKKNELLVLKNLGVAYFNKGEIKLAETVFLNALQVAPTDKQLYQYMVTVYKQQGNNKLAAEFEAKLK